MNKSSIVLFFAVLLCVFYTSEGFCQSQFVTSAMSTNDHALNPSGLFFDKGFGMQMNYRTQYMYGKSYSSSPSNIFLGSKYVFKGNLNKKKNASKTVFPGIGVLFNYNPSGAVFSSMNFAFQTGVRIDLKNNRSNNYFAGALEYKLTNYSAVSKDGLVLTDINDPSFNFIGIQRSFLSAIKIGVNLNVSGQNDRYFSANLAYYQPLGEGNYAILNSPYLGGALKFMWTDFTQNYFGFKAFQSYSLCSFSLPFTYFLNGNLQLSPSVEFPINKLPIVYPGNETLRSFRIGGGFRINALRSSEYMIETFNSVFLSFKYELGTSNVKNKFRQTRHETGIGYDQFLGPLVTSTMGPNLFYSYNTEKLLNACLFNKREFYEILRDKKDLAKAKEFYEKELSKMPCFEFDEERKSLESEYAAILESLNVKEIDLISLNNVQWTSSNLSLNKLNTGAEVQLATSFDEWSELCKEGKPAYCYYNFDKNNESYGFIYNVYAAAEIAPDGYRIPSPEDWENLRKFADGKKTAKDEYSIYNLQCLLFNKMDVNTDYCNANALTSNFFNHRQYGYIEYNGKFSFKKIGSMKNGGAGGYWSLEDASTLDISKGMGVQCAAFIGSKYNDQIKKLGTDPNAASRYGFYIRLIKNQ
jgi:uncharacterized protein (TIGR02145 family)